MTRKEALAFIHSHGWHLLAEDVAEDLAQVFGHSLGEIGINPKTLTAAFPSPPLPGLEGLLTVPMPYLAAALAGMGSMPSRATSVLWNTISQFSVETMEHERVVEHGPAVEEITLHIHFAVQDRDEPVKESGETFPQSA